MAPLISKNYLEIRFPLFAVRRTA